MTPVAECAACGARDGLEPHLRVAGDQGPGGLIPTTDRFGTALSDIVRCRACGHMQLAQMPMDGELDRAYAAAASDDYVDEEAGQRETARRILSRIEALAPQPDGRPRALLDLGCWVGFLLAEARERGWQVAGVEPSEFASAYAREQLALDVRRESLFSARLPESSFEGVVLGDVIEPLPRPGEALERIASLLAPGGVVWLSLPDAGS